MAVELASLAVIGLAMLLFGWVVLQNVARFTTLSAAVLGVVGVLQLVSVRRNLAAGGPSARIRATRDVAFVAAAFLGMAYVLTLQRWGIGACIAAFEFGILLELLARFVPAAPDGGGA